MKRNLNRLMGLLLTIALAIGLMAGMSITALADNTGAYSSYLVSSTDILHTASSIPAAVDSLSSLSLPFPLP